MALKTRACSAKQRLSQQTFLAYVTNDGKIATMFDNIPLSQWQIISFDPKSRSVCIEVDNGFRVILLYFTIPSIILTTFGN